MRTVRQRCWSLNEAVSPCAALHVVEVEWAVEAEVAMVAVLRRAEVERGRDPVVHPRAVEWEEVLLVKWMGREVRSSEKVIALFGATTTTKKKTKRIMVLITIAMKLSL